MRRPSRTTSTLAALAALVLAVGCTGEEDVPADPTRTTADGAADDGQPSGGAEAGRHAGWQEVSLPGGSFALPPDWEEQPPIADDDVTYFGPDDGEVPSLVLRARVSGRDAVPFSELPQLFAATLAFSAGDIEPLGQEELTIPGAEEAVLLTFRYDETIDGEDVPSEERVVLAWFGDDRQIQVRTGGPVELVERDDLVDEIVATIDLEG